MATKKNVNPRIIAHHLGYAGGVDSHPNEFAWILTDPAPAYREGRLTHFFVDGYTNAVRLAEDEWTTDLEVVGQVVDEKGNEVTEPRASRDQSGPWFVRLNEVGAKLASVPYVPPPSPFDDDAGNRKAHQKHAAAIRKVLDACLSFSSTEEMAAAINMLDKGEAVTLHPGDIEEKVAEVAARFEVAQPLAAALKGLDDTERNSVLKHATHYFDVKKGVTSYR